MINSEVAVRVQTEEGDGFCNEVYQASPLELAFDTVLKKRFGCALQDAWITSKQDSGDSTLIRRASARVDEREIAFRYWRKDPLKVLEGRPYRSRSEGRRALAMLSCRGERLRDPLEIEAASPRSEAEYTATINLVRDRVLTRDNKMSPFLALTDPGYYNSAQRVAQWPEKFAFFIFSGATTASQGRMVIFDPCISGETLEFTGILLVPLCLEDQNGHNKTGLPSSLTVCHPRVSNRLNLALLGAGYLEQFPRQSPVAFSDSLSDDGFDQQIMDNFGNLAFLLAKEN